MFENLPPAFPLYLVEETDVKIAPCHLQRIDTHDTGTEALRVLCALRRGKKGPCTMLQGRGRRPSGGRVVRGRRSQSVEETDGTGWVLSAWIGGKLLSSRSAERLCSAFRISYHCPSEFSLAHQCQVKRSGAFLRVPRGGLGLSWDTLRGQITRLGLGGGGSEVPTFESVGADAASRQWDQKRL